MRLMSIFVVPLERWFSETRIRLSNNLCIKMKKLYFVAIILMSMMVMPSCGHKPKVKMIPASHVVLSGEHKDFLEVAGDAKVMLVQPNPNSNDWEIRAIVPIRNTAPWSTITGGDMELEASLDPSMSKASVVFTNEFGDQVYGYWNDSDLDHDIIESVMKCDYQTSENMVIKAKKSVYNAVFVNQKYKDTRKAFDQVDGILIADMSIVKPQSRWENTEGVMTKVSSVLDLIGKAQALGIW